MAYYMCWPHVEGCNVAHLRFCQVGREGHVHGVPEQTQTCCQNQRNDPGMYSRQTAIAFSYDSVAQPADLSTQQVELKVPATRAEGTPSKRECLQCPGPRSNICSASGHLLTFGRTIGDDC